MSVDLVEDDGNFQLSGDVNTDAEIKLMEEIALLAADAAKTFKGKYSDKAIQALLLAGKYNSICLMSPTAKEYFVEAATGFHRCPMCQFYYCETESCKECPLSDGQDIYCGHNYNNLLYSMMNGSQVDVFFNVSFFVKKILKR